MKAKTEFQTVKEAYIQQVKEARRGITLTWYVPGGSKREYDKKVEEIYEVLNDFKVRFTDLGVDKEGKVTLIVQSMRDVETVENEMGFDPEFVDFREGDIEIAEGAQRKKRQVNEVRTMSARDLGKKIDSLEDVHQDIRMSMIDTISDVNTRKKLESRLQKSYDQYFKVLAEIEKMLK